MFNIQKLVSFNLAFLVVGLPILFIIREYMPIPKALFTYSIIGLILLTLVNYKNLLKLVSIAGCDGFYYKPRIDKKLLKKILFIKKNFLN